MMEYCCADNQYSKEQFWLSTITFGYGLPILSKHSGGSCEVGRCTEILHSRTTCIRPVCRQRHSNDIVRSQYFQQRGNTQHMGPAPSHRSIAEKELQKFLPAAIAIYNYNRLLKLRRPHIHHWRPIFMPVCNHLLRLRNSGIHDIKLPARLVPQGNRPNLAEHIQKNARRFYPHAIRSSMGLL